MSLEPVAASAFVERALSRKDDQDDHVSDQSSACDDGGTREKTFAPAPDPARARRREYGDREQVWLQGQLTSANEQLGGLVAATARGDAIEADVADRDAELELLRSENVTLTTALAQTERDMEDIEKGVMPRSRVPGAAEAILSDVVAASVKREQTPPRKAKEAGEELTPVGAGITSKTLARSVPQTGFYEPGPNGCRGAGAEHGKRRSIEAKGIRVGKSPTEITELIAEITS